MESTAATFRIENFEGPLDLLLTLVQKNKMALSDIPILSLINQYLEVVQTQRQSLDADSDFIEMAARFVHMKSVFLLPKEPEGEKLRQELFGLLTQYAACKEAAQKLRALKLDIAPAVRPPLLVESAVPYSRQHDPKLLAAALLELPLRKAVTEPPQPAFFNEITRPEPVSVSSRILFVLRGLVKGTFRSLHQLFAKTRSRSDAVATFLAVLELMKAGRLRLTPDQDMRVMRPENREGGAHGTN